MLYWTSICSIFFSGSSKKSRSACDQYQDGSVFIELTSKVGLVIKTSNKANELGSVTVTYCYSHKHGKLTKLRVRLYGAELFMDTKFSQKKISRYFNEILQKN